MEVFENAIQTRYLSYSCGRGFFLNTEKKISVFENWFGYEWPGPEFKWAPCEKRNNLDDLINIPTMAEELSVNQISGLGPKIRTSRQAQSRIRRAKIHSWSTIHYVFKFHDLPQKSIIGTVNDLINAFSLMNASYLINAPLSWQVCFKRPSLTKVPCLINAPLPWN